MEIHFFSSELHDKASVRESRKYLEAELSRLEAETTEGCLCFIATGGTEEMFLKALPELPTPIILLSDGLHNSFAASFEIATYLSMHGIAHRFINYPLPESISRLVDKEPTMLPPKPGAAKEKAVGDYLEKSVIGLVGMPSPWLIASDVDLEAVERKSGCRFVHIDIKELEGAFFKLLGDEASDTSRLLDDPKRRLANADLMYQALNDIVEKYGLTAVTVRCFDLLPGCKTTSCLALARLNDRGIIAGCEGDIPTLWTMMNAYAETGIAPFMVNPSSSDPEAMTVDLAHCTVPLGLTASHKLPTHFESNLSVGIAGMMPLGEYKLMKIGGKHLDRRFEVNGEIIANTAVLQRCRTQVRFQFPDRVSFDSFMANRLGNHLVLVPA